MRNPFLGLAFHHLMHRPLRVSLTILGVGVGVAAVLAMHLANQEIFRSFEDTVTYVVGEAAIQVTGVESLLDEKVIPTIRAHPGVHSLTVLLTVPVVAVTPSGGEIELSIWAMDVLELLDENEFTQQETQGPGDYLDLILNPHTLFLGERLAASLEVVSRQVLDIRIGSRVFRMTIGGILKDTPGHAANPRMGIMDIASAQSLFGLVGEVSQVDIVIDPGRDPGQVIQELQERLGASTQVRRSARRPGRIEQMLKSFQLNLMTLSTVGLFVGVFLIYNVVGFSVVQYRREIGILRALGAFRHQIAALFLGEAAVIGILGGLLGTLIGVTLATFLVTLESQTVNELYATLEVQPITVSLQTLLLGAGLGMLLALVGAIAPCIEASRTHPARALAAGPYDQTVIMAPALMASFSLAVFILAAALTVPDAVHGIPVFGYGAAFCILLGTTLLAPLSLQLLERVVRSPLKNFKGPVPQLAMDHMIRSPGRHGVTVSALVVGLAIVISVGVMVKSFRDTVEMWINQTMMADLIVSPQSGLSDVEEGDRAPRFSEEMIQTAVKIHGVAAVDPYRHVRALIGAQEGVLVSRDFSVHKVRSRYLFLHGNSEEILERTLAQEGVIVSEVLAERLGIQSGASLSVSHRGKEYSFEVIGIFYDYATDGGKVVIDRSIFRRLWGDSSANVLAVYREPSTQELSVGAELQEVLASYMPVSIINNQELRQEILEIFDRTFRMTHGLELIAVVVGVLGIINTLMTTVLERRREFATYRALGAGLQQIRQMVLWESFLIGVLGVILGIVGGLLLGALLVHVINKQSFGWTVPFVLSGRTLLEAVLVGGVASFVAGYLPARWVVKGPIAEGLRFE